MTAFKSLATAMVKIFYRDKATLFFTFVFPLMFLVIFGLLFRDAGASRTEIAVVGDGPVIAGLQQTGALELTHFRTVDEAVQKVRDGDLPAMVAQDGDEVTYRFAQSDQTQASIVGGIVQGVVSHMNQQATGEPEKYTIDASNVEDSSLKPIQYITPGIMSWGVAVTAVFGAALTLVSWRKKQVLRRIRLAPVGATTVLTARVVVTVGVAIVQVMVFIGVGLLPIFGLQLTGTWWLSIPVFLLGILAFFSIGMLVGAFCKTEEAATAAANIVVLPMAFLSGTFFPIDAAPQWLRTVSQIFPLRHMNDGITDFLVRGQGASALVLPCVVLSGFVLVVGAIAAKVFQWEDD
ncbi:ABC transporter permease [Actinophytocola oryzae]|uniref:Transport permease protein n=1 Tax=Actinophytocola oryzae TaxID=502181 RepID=A0A4R7VVJ2_9PSEU|nr:ABC transporter permease [Actinophytocola oryzae]TDV54043.1 ABC-2 type transport system permease protein [Actinophytocola oryzae]